MSAAEVVAQSLYERLEWSGCNGSRWDLQPDQVARIHQAQVQLDALRAAGYAVVELPDPDARDSYDFGDDCTALWSPPDGEVEWYQVAVHGDLIDLSDVDEELDPASARLLAGVLLAAADAAEATK